MGGIERIALLESALRNLLNDCINFGGDNLTGFHLKAASDLLKTEDSGDGVLTREESDMSEATKRCFQCGSAPMEIDWSNVVENSGITSQTAMIMCGAENNIGCPVAVTIGVCPEYSLDTDRVEWLLAKMWNDLSL